MKQITIKELLKAELLKVCSGITKKLRDKDEKKDKKRKFTREQQAEIENKLKMVGWNGVNLQHVLDVLSIVSEAPELKAGSMIPRDLFAVVVLEANTAQNHAYVLNVPLISTSEKTSHLLHNDGVTGNWQYQISDKPRLATDKEVKACINSLNDKQWKTIMTHEVFKPVMDAVMNKAVSIDSVEDNSNGERNGSDEDIVLPDGRTIEA